MNNSVTSAGTKDDSSNVADVTTSAPIMPNPMLGDVYRDILSLFQGTDDFRPAMKLPFFQEDFVIATDAHKLVCFKKELLKTIDFESHEKAPNALAVIPTEGIVDIDLDVEKLIKGISKSNKAVSKRYKIVECECPDCGGGGYVDYIFKDYRGKQYEIEETCPTCENETDFTMITEIETGNEIKGFQELIKIGNTLFDVTHFEKMVEAAQMLNVKSIKITNKKSDTSIHKFVVGECTICLVPVSNFDDCDVVTNIA